MSPIFRDTFSLNKYFLIRLERLEPFDKIRKTKGLPERCTEIQMPMSQIIHSKKLKPSPESTDSNKLQCHGTLYGNINLTTNHLLEDLLVELRKHGIGVKEFASKELKEDIFRLVEIIYKHSRVSLSCIDFLILTI